MHGCLITPQPEQIEFSFAQSLPDATPHCGISFHTRPPAM
jgi:hypothetical protein